MWVGVKGVIHSHGTLTDEKRRTKNGKERRKRNQI